MARPISHGPPACATAPSTTSTITHANVHLYGESSETRRLAVVARSAAFSCGAPAMDCMPLISGLLAVLLDDEPWHSSRRFRRRLPVRRPGGSRGPGLSAP